MTHQQTQNNSLFHVLGQGWATFLAGEPHRPRKGWLRASAQNRVQSDGVKKKRSYHLTMSYHRVWTWWSPEKKRSSPSA